MDDTRRGAYLALRDVEESKAFSNIAVSRAIKKTTPAGVPFLRELVYGTLRNQIYLDWLIGKFIKTPVEKLPASDRILLRMGLYQLMSMNSVPDYAAVNETVELAKKYAKGRERFLNGVLRSYLREKDEIALPSGDGTADKDVNYLSVKYSFAPWIVQMWMDEFGVTERVECLLESLNTKPRLCLRVNTLKTNATSLKQQLEQQQFMVGTDEDLPNLLYTEGEGLLDTDLYKEGFFSVQDKGSQIVCEALGAKPGDTVADVCAAPGGKSMTIAEGMNNRGSIAALDIREHRLGLIEEAAGRLGVQIVTTQKRDGRQPDKTLAGKLDCVLVDAPCSGLGTARRKPEVKYKPFDAEMRDLPKMQFDILKASSGYVKRGGTLVYSTCTIAQRENGKVVDAFLKDSGAFEIVDRAQLVPFANGTDGFFVCKMQRIH
ncbi:ribosomal RNA small subunit methyltransferase B [Clostridia bacterium]|nr:ribosomal RNA small subunit methyltransferase B [Clostridia bacterium]